MALEERDPEDPRSGRQSGREARRMLLIGAIASAGGIALALLIDWFPTAASRQAGPIDTFWDVLLIVSVPVFVLVETVVLYSVVRFRMRPGEEEIDGPPVHGNTRLEVIWTAVPAILLVILCGYAYVVLTDIEEAKADRELPVRVVGEQFTWTFYYRGQGGKEVSSHQLYLPANQHVLFTVQSEDVLHDFWVPAFRMKIDAVPGIDTHIRVDTTERLGTFPVVCAELCGLGHSVMRQSAHVVSRQDFDAWMQRQSQAAQGGGAAGGGGGGGGGEAADGKTIFTSAQPTACSTCHTLADAGANGTAGPNLDEELPGKSKDFIRQSIVDPNAEIAEGYSPGIMPVGFGDSLSPEQLDALVEYLAEVSGK
jgi:cytochrome c oxidase subunit 2